MANHTPDDGFHEIQLNGKQLVFLFMAATVVSVVIFLCGVLVGRGVRVERGSPMADAVVNPIAAAEGSGSTGGTASPLPQPAATLTPPAAGSDPTAASPPPAVDDLTYFKRLEKQKTPPETLKTTAETHRTAAASTPKERPASASSSEPAGMGTGPGAGPGYSIQIAALGERSDADALAKGLSSKGYTAYVVPPPSGAPTVFRVRVGKFNSRREAETVAVKLEKEEHFKPWITR